MCKRAIGWAAYDNLAMSWYIVLIQGLKNAVVFGYTAAARVVTETQSVSASHGCVMYVLPDPFVGSMICIR